MSPKEQNELQRLREENERLKAQQAARTTVSFKVSDKGGVSVYGLGRFPVTLYQEQWHSLLAKAEELKKFLQENKAKLKVKGS